MSCVRRVIELLEQLIKDSQKEIGEIQKSCDHKKLLHKSWVEYQQSQGGSTCCYDCKKMISCYSGMWVEAAKDAEWVEEEGRIT